MVGNKITDSVRTKLAGAETDLFIAFLDRCDSKNDSKSFKLE
jgi:hypothetical protein